MEGGHLEVKHNLVYHDGAVLALCKIDENEFLSGGADGLLNRINISGELVATIQAHNEWIWDIARSCWLQVEICILPVKTVLQKF